MSIESQIQVIEKKVVALISPDPSSFLVEVKISPGNNVKVFLDADQGMSIERLTQINRALYRQIEESDLFPNGDFSLEVSSPGLDEPLKVHRQYAKNVGRFVDVVLKSGIKREGKLVVAAEDAIVIEEMHGQKKQKEIVQNTIPTEEIKTTKIQIRF